MDFELVQVIGNTKLYGYKGRMVMTKHDVISGTLPESLTGREHSIKWVVLAPNGKKIGFNSADDLKSFVDKGKLDAVIKNRNFYYRYEIEGID